MRSKRSPNSTQPDPKSAADELMKVMFEHGKAQFGSAVKSFWFYDGDLCAACQIVYTGHYAAKYHYRWDKSV